jgi:hypothetical protein
VSLLDDVDRTLAALAPEDLDAASAGLLRAYARELDAAEAVAASAAKILARVSRDADPDAYEALSALQAQLSRRQALVAIGKNYQALLKDMQALRTTRDRTAPVAGTGALGRLRALS